MMTLLLLVLLAASPIDRTAQENRDKKGLAEEQDRQRKRVERLRQTMGSLLGRLEKEGRTRAAELLRQGLAQLEEAQVERAMAELSVHIEEGRPLQSLEKQEKLLRDLEDLLDILLDRKDLEKIEKDLKAIEELVRSMEDLRRKESEILRETSRINADAASAAEKETAQAIEQLLRQQEALLRKTEESGSSELRTLEDVRKALGELLARQEKAREKIGLWAGSEGRPKERHPAATRAFEEARKLAEAAEAARDAVERRKGKEDPESIAGDLERLSQEIAKDSQGSSQMEKSSEDLGSLASEIRKPVPAKDLAERAAALSRDAGEAGQMAKDLSQMLASRERLEIAAEEREIRRLVDKLARTLQSSREIPQRAETAAPFWKASEALQGAADGLEKGDPSKAQSSAKAAADRLREAEQALESAARAAEENVGPRMKALAEEQRALEEETKKLAEAIPERLRRQELQPGQAEGVRQETEEARQAMSQAGSRLDRGESGEAARSQREAVDRLRQAQKKLRQGRKLAEAQRNEALDLARKQEDLQEEILRLAEKMKESNNRNASKNLDAAQEKAGQAADDLDRGDLGEAEPKEEQAEKYLRQAQDDLDEEKQKYLRLRQEELLFRIADEIRSMIKTHEEARHATAEAESERQQAGGTLGRTLKLKIQKVAKDEEGVGADCARVAEALEKEEIRVYAYLLRSCEEDLMRVAELMGRDGEYRSDELVQGLQQDVSERFDGLLKALQDEIQNRSKRPEPRGRNNPNHKEKLVPDVAELRMLKRMEDDLAARTQRLLEWEQRGTGEDPILRREVERLAARHNRITELFSEFKKRLGIE